MPTIAQHRFQNSLRYRPEDHDRQRRLTPAYVLEPIRELLGGIELDPCTEADNPTRATRYYTPPQDGCALPWDALTIFCNPPYGEARLRWVKRCIAESADRKIVLLIPSHTETKVSQLAMQNATSVLYVRSRLRFGIPRKSGWTEEASHGSAVYGFNVDLTPIAHLGTVLYRQNAEVSEGGTRDSRIETAAQSRPSLH